MQKQYIPSNERAMNMSAGLVMALLLLAACDDGGSTGGTTGESIMPEPRSDAEPPPDDEPPLALVKACTSACKRIFACIDNLPPFQDKQSCTDACIRKVDNEDPDCLSSTVEFDQCLAGLPCAQLQTSLQTMDFGPCMEALQGSEKDCRVCPAASGFGTNDFCILEEHCPGEYVQGVSCEGDTCTCTEGGEPTGECPANDVCLHPTPVRALERMAEECCGFDFNIG
jgi:hypothetical protein